MRILSYLAAIACAVAPIIAQPVGTDQTTDVARRVPEPYTVKIYYGDGSDVKHVLAFHDKEKRQDAINMVMSKDAKRNGDWYLCPTMDAVEEAKRFTSTHDGVVYDAGFPVWGDRSISPFVVLIGSQGVSLKLMCTFKQPGERDTFRKYLRNHHYTADVDWDIQLAPYYMSTMEAISAAKYYHVKSAFELDG